jgi:hypothetical protein
VTAAEGVPADDGHRTTITLDGERFETLADLPPRPGHLLFVGACPAVADVEAGHYHQGPAGRALWERLVAAAVLPRGTPLEQADDVLAAEGHGLTCLAKRPCQIAATGQATPAFGDGVGHLWQRIAIWRPAAVVFVDRAAAEASAGRPLREPWGVLDGVALAGRPCMLLPGPDVPPDVAATTVNFLRNLAASLPR